MGPNSISTHLNFFPAEFLDRSRVIHMARNLSVANRSLSVFTETYRRFSLFLSFFFFSSPSFIYLFLDFLLNLYLTERVRVTVKPLICIREVIASILGQGIGCSRYIVT
jgi:hypothetical protein